MKVSGRFVVVAGGGEAIGGLITLAEKEFRPVDLCFTNAGIAGAPGLDADEAARGLALDINLRAHIRADIDEDRFVILPHPQVLDMYRRKDTDCDRWPRGMRCYQASLQEQGR